jgi:hypothetical protein
VRGAALPPDGCLIEQILQAAQSFKSLFASFSSEKEDFLGSFSKKARKNSCLPCEFDAHWRFPRG